jgi:hypothetical protein
MMIKTLFRIILDILLFIAVINGWWPIVVVMAVIGLWFFRFYAEAILAGVAYDALYGMIPDMGWKGYTGTIVAVILSVAAKFVKKSMR